MKRPAFGMLFLTMDLSKKRLSAKVVKSQTQKITVALIGNAASGKEIAVPEDIKDSFSNIKIIFLQANTRSMLQPLDKISRCTITLACYDLLFLKLKLLPLHQR